MNIDWEALRLSLEVFSYKERGTPLWNLRKDYQWDTPITPQATADLPPARTVMKK